MRWRGKTQHIESNLVKRIACSVVQVVFNCAQKPSCAKHAHGANIKHMSVAHLALRALKESISPLLVVLCVLSAPKHASRAPLVVTTVLHRNWLVLMCGYAKIALPANTSQSTNSACV